MITILDLKKKYASQIAPLDLELLFSFVLNKPREFVLSHPEHKLSKLKIKNLELKIARRAKSEPMAYILGKKEFYGLDFKVDKNTLVSRPETELMVELALGELRNLLRNKLRNISVIDVGTGSGNIIISILSELRSSKLKVQSSKFFGTDISAKALAIAKRNAKDHNLGKKINFLQGNLLDPIIGNLKLGLRNSRTIVLANLPYLSSEIYASAPKDVKNYEPKSALWSPQKGLGHYDKLLKQVQKLLITDYRLPVTLMMEISPEQKPLLRKIILKILPSAKIIFHKDLAQKWRVCEIKL